MVNTESKLSKDLNPFIKFSQRYISEIDNFIKNFFYKKKKSAEFEFITELYNDLLEYCLREGKRIRPLILLISYLGYTKSKKGLGEIIKIASAIELMHSFLLVQDDIIDKSPLRRGGKALHIVSYDRYWDKTTNKNIGNDIALILGDVLFSNAIEIIGSSKISPKIKSDFLVLFAETYELTAWGQILDSLNSLPKRLDLNEEIPIRISLLKTAYYTIYKPMLMGLILSGKDEKQERDRIYNFSIPLGLAFQIRDDILGIFGNREKTGKSSESDIVEGKNTILIQKTMQKLGKKELKQFISILKKEKKSKTEIAFIKRKIKQSGALEISTEKIKELADNARNGLDDLNVRNEYKIILSGLVDMITVF